MIARNCHCPGFVSSMQRDQEFCGVFDVPFRVEHLFQRVEILVMEIVVDLHATNIDQFRALLLGQREGLHGICHGVGEQRLALDIESVRLK